MNANTKQALENLNFTDILHYARPVKRCCRSNNGKSPLHTCSGFCHDCEDKHLAPKGGSKFILMSHGCTSDDFVEIIGTPLPKIKCRLPIMFLLENPGKDYGNGGAVTCNGVTKNPPINHFYFSPDLNYWPTSIDQTTNRYGDYFAYLLAKFGLANVYITNCIKCKYTPASLPELKEDEAKKCYADTANNCIERFLEKEIDIFRPRIIFCFGGQVNDELLYKRIQSPGKLPNVQFIKIKLYHPNADRWNKITWDDAVKRNDRRISEALAAVM